MLRIFLRAIRTTLCRMSPGAPRDAKLGAISFLHRFGSSLNTHFHYHVVVLDGAFSHGPNNDARFHGATLLESHHWLELQRVVQRRVLRYFSFSVSFVKHQNDMVWVSSHSADKLRMIH